MVPECFRALPDESIPRTSSLIYRRHCRRFRRVQDYEKHYTRMEAWWSRLTAIVNL